LDLRYIRRSLLSSPWYAGTVVCTTGMTLALAATTFAIVDGVLFKPLPYPAARQLFSLEGGFSGIPRTSRNVGAISPVELERWRQAAGDIPITGFRAQPWAGLGPSVDHSSAGVALVDEKFFDVIGVRPLIGGFTVEDFQTQVEPRIRPAVILHEVWQARFGGTSDVIGREIISDRSVGVGVRIVGVMPPGFVFPSTSSGVSFLAPFFVGSADRNNPRARVITGVIARLPESVTPVALEGRLSPELRVVAAIFPPRGQRPTGWSETGWRRQGPYDALHVEPLRETVGRQTRPLFQAVTASVLMLVVLACINISGLMAARALEHESQVGLRKALGASTWAIAQLWLLESTTLVVMGAIAGLAATPWLIWLSTELLPTEIVLLKSAEVDWRVVGFVSAATILMAVSVSMAPLRRSHRLKPLVAARETGVVRTPGRFVLISSQIAAAFGLTVVGVALVGSLLSVYAVDLPVRTDDILAFDAFFQGPGASMEVSPVRAERARTLIEALRTLPSVEGAAATAAQVLRGSGGMTWFQPPAGRTHPQGVNTWPVSEGFFQLLEPHVVAGRLPTYAEQQSSAPLIVVSENVARAYWPDRSPLGQSLIDEPTKAAYSVVGVVREVRWLAWDMESPVIYAPYTPVARAPWATFFVRARGNNAQLMDDIVREFSRVDSNVRLSRASTLNEAFRSSVRLRRFQALLFGGFALAALAVVGTGILGLMAMSAARRTREMGIRYALGATPRSVIGLMLREQTLAVLVGLAAGTLIATWALPFVQQYLYQLRPSDPRVWMAATGLILLTATAGILAPAMRASRADPLNSLRAS
jgi:predicted permease